MKFIIALFALICLTAAYQPDVPTAARPISMPHPGALPAAAPRQPDPTEPPKSQPKPDDSDKDDDEEEEKPPAKKPSSGGLGFGGFLGSGSFFSKGQKMSGQMNDAILQINGVTGQDTIKPLSEQEGVLRLFFTATPSITPTPSMSMTPTSSPTPSETPSVSVTPSVTPSTTASTTPKVTASASKSPSPTPSNSIVPNTDDDTTITASLGLTAIPTSGDPITVFVSFAGTGAQVGDAATCSTFQVAGDFDPSLTPQARFARNFSSAKVLIPGVARQALQCGVRLEGSESDGSTSTFWLEPEVDVGCAPQDIDISDIQITVTEQNGVLGCYFEAKAFCFTDECPAVELEFQCSITGSGQGVLTPVPSN